jgi:micrococcal nuclease
VDGDTFTVQFPDGHTEDVRLLGVDTPEVHVENDPSEFEGIPSTQSGHDWLRDWGHKASEFSRAEVLDETVRIRTDPNADRRGSYDRLLVYVGAEGEKTLNEKLIEQGYARLYDSSFSQRDEFEADEAYAQENNVGLWGYEQQTTTTTTTTTTATDGGSESPESAIVVTNVHADAPGDDHENLNEEYVVLKNTGDTTVDLNGWTVSDEADHAYIFSDVQLEPGETVTLYTGSGTDGSNEVYWGAGSAVWNNGGDTVIVRNASGTVVDEYSYA